MNGISQQYRPKPPAPVECLSMNFESRLAQFHQLMPAPETQYNETHSEVFSQVKRNLGPLLHAADDQASKEAFEIIAHLCMYSQHIADLTDSYRDHDNLFQFFSNKTLSTSPTTKFFLSTFYDQGRVAPISTVEAINLLEECITISNSNNRATHASLNAAFTLETYYRKTFESAKSDKSKTPGEVKAFEILVNSYLEQKNEIAATLSVKEAKYKLQ